MNKFIASAVCMFFLSAPPLIFADRWLILPPRLELSSSEDLRPNPKEAALSQELQRAMVLYLKASRVPQVSDAQDAESCLRQENLNMQQRISVSELKRVAQSCQAERMLVTRVRRHKGQFEITSKVFFRESSALSDTLMQRGENLNQALGETLSERFQKSPRVDKDNLSDLIVVGDTHGKIYFDWLAMKNFFLSLDSVKNAYCLVNQHGKVQSYTLKSNKESEKKFLDALHFEGGAELSNTDDLLRCAKTAIDASLSSARRPVVVFLVSTRPGDNPSRIALKTFFRKIASRTSLFLVTAASIEAQSARFWSSLARELSPQVHFLPSAQRARAGLLSGQEWYVFRQRGRLFESREENPTVLKSGILIPEKYSEDTSPTDLLNLYATLSGNKVVTKGTTEIWNGEFETSIANAFKENVADKTAWRVMLKQNGHIYYVSLSAKNARKLKVGEFARIYTELLPPSAHSPLRNRVLPTLVLKRASESHPALEISILDYLRNPTAYLRQAMGARSFYVLTGEVVRILPQSEGAESDAFSE